MVFDVSIVWRRVTGKDPMRPAHEEGYSVVAVMFFGKHEVARFPTREQAEQRVAELNEAMERQPRGYIQYVVRPASQGRRRGR